MGGFPREGRSKPSAADLNMMMYSGNTQSRPFIRERFMNYIIDISDSEEDEEERENTPNSLPSRKVSDMDAVKKRMEEIEKQKKALQEKMKLIAAKKRKALENNSGIPNSAKANQHIESSGVPRAQSMPSLIDGLPTTKNANAPANGGIFVRKTSSTAEAGTVNGSPINHTAGNSPPAPKNPPEAQRSSPFIIGSSTEQEVAAEVKKIASASRLLRKQQLENEVAQEETSLIAKQSEIAEDEKVIKDLQARLQGAQAKRAETEKALNERRVLLEKLKKMVEEDEAAINSSLRLEQELQEQLSSTKKQLLVRGAEIPDIHKSINAKRVELLELSKPQSNGSTSSYAQPNNGSEFSSTLSREIAETRSRPTRKRANSDPENNSSKRVKITVDSAASPLPSWESDMIALLKRVLADSDAFISRDTQQLPTTFPVDKKEKALQNISWDEDLTISPLFLVCGFVRSEADMALMSDVYDSPFLANGRWNCAQEVEETDELVVMFRKLRSV